MGLPNGAPPVIGTLEIVLSHDGSSHTEIVYSLPSNTNDIKGIALLLHACGHGGRNFFSRSESCDTCNGLSEEMRITRILQSKSLAVLAVTSSNRKDGCWRDEDADHIKNTLELFKASHHIEQTIPVLALGTSSGGIFAAQLAVRKLVNAAVVGVMSLGPQLTTKWVNMEGTKPPIYFAPMPRDTETVAKVETDYQAMNGQGPVVLDRETCQSRPVDASYLNERVPGLTMSQAQAITNSLTETGHIDAITGLLVKDPTSTTGLGANNWKSVLQSSCASQGCLENQSLEVGVSPLAKALNRAWAFHEYCSEVTLKALGFFETELAGAAFLPS